MKVLVIQALTTDQKAILRKYGQDVKVWRTTKKGMEAINRNMDLSELVETAVKKEIKSSLDLARYSLKNRRKENET